MLILGPLVAPRISAVISYRPSSAGSLMTLSSSTTRTAGSVTLDPTSPVSLSTVRTSSTDAFSCLPPQRTIAYTANSSPLHRPGRGLRLQHTCSRQFRARGPVSVAHRLSSRGAARANSCAEDPGYQNQDVPRPPGQPGRAVCGSAVPVRVGDGRPGAAARPGRAVGGPRRRPGAAPAAPPAARSRLGRRGRFGRLAARVRAVTTGAGRSSGGLGRAAGAAAAGGAIALDAITALDAVAALTGVAVPDGVAAVTGARGRAEAHPRTEAGDVIGVLRRASRADRDGPGDPARASAVGRLTIVRRPALRGPAARRPAAVAAVVGRAVPGA